MTDFLTGRTDLTVGQGSNRIGLTDQGILLKLLSDRKLRNYARTIIQRFDEADIENKCSRELFLKLSNQEEKENE